MGTRRDALHLSDGGSRRDTTNSAFTRHLLIAACVGSAVLFCAAGRVFSQSPPLQVQVNGSVYLVQGTAVTAQNGGLAPDAFTVRKANFTARILDEQILHSEFNRQLFDPTTRAIVFRDERSGRLNEPWRRAIVNGSSGADKALVGAKETFKAWAAKLANDPQQLASAVVRQDYLRSIGAYRENVAIYRKVTMQHEPLSYDDASRFLSNQMSTTRLVSAATLESELDQPAAAATGPQAGNLSRLQQRLRTEVLDKADALKTASDIRKSRETIRRIAMSEVPLLKSYGAGIKPATIRLGNSPSNALAINVPPPAAKSAQPFNITGGILPSPYPLARAAPAGGVRAANSSSVTARANQSAAGAGSQQGAGGTGASPGGGQVSGSGAPGNSIASGGGDLASSPEQGAGNGDISSAENLKTFSSKPYHSDDGWVFNPESGVWQNPDDPSQTRSPTVITCCDDTGLAFPNDAVEAQQAFWDGGGVDPNCGRLYNCGPTADPSHGPGPDTATASTDMDVKIWKALSYIGNDNSMTPEEKGEAITNFLNNLPPQYRSSGVQILQNYNMRHGGGYGGGRGMAPTSAMPSGGFQGRTIREPDWQSVHHHWT